MGLFPIAAEPKEGDPVVLFCPRCLADERGGSWGGGPEGGGAWCSNCGAGPAVVLPAWAVDSVRQQASWVGKRYYPNAEDRELALELRALRVLACELRPPAGRTVEKTETEGGYEVKQETGSGRWTMVYLDAVDDESALAAAAPLLPYPRGR